MLFVAAVGLQWELLAGDSNSAMSHQKVIGFPALKSVIF